MGFCLQRFKHLVSDLQIVYIQVTYIEKTSGEPGAGPATRNATGYPYKCRNENTTRLIVP